MQNIYPIIIQKTFILLLLTTLLIVPFASFPQISTESTIIDSKFLSLTILLGIIIFTGSISAINHLSNIKQRFKLYWFDITFLLFGLITIYSTINSAHTEHALKTGMTFWLLFGLHWLLQISITDLKLIRKITWFIIGVGGLIILNMGLNFIGIYPLNSFFPYEKSQLVNRGIFVSVLGNPEYTACFLTPIATFCLAGLFSSGKKKVFWLLLFGIFTTFSVLTQSRGVILGLMGGVIGIFIYLTQMNFKFHTSLKKLIAITASILIIFTITISLFSTSNILNPNKRINLYPRIISVFNPAEFLSDPRLIQNTVGTELLKDNYWLGSGFGSVEKKYFSKLGELTNETQGEYLKTFTHINPDLLLKNIHNDWLELAIEHGIFGLFLFIMTLAFLFMNRKGNLSILEIQLKTALIAYLFFFFTSFPLHTAPRQLYFWLIFSLLMCCLRNSQCKPEIQFQNFTLIFWRPVLVSVCLWLIFLISFWVLNSNKTYLAKSYLHSTLNSFNNFNITHFYQGLEPFQALVEMQLGDKSADNQSFENHWNNARRNFEISKSYSNFEADKSNIFLVISTLKWIYFQFTESEELQLFDPVNFSNYWQNILPQNLQNLRSIQNSYQQMKLEANQKEAIEADIEKWAGDMTYFPKDFQTQPANLGSAEFQKNFKISFTKIPNAKRYHLFLWKTGEQRPTQAFKVSRENNFSIDVTQNQIYFWTLEIEGEINKLSTEIFTFKVN